MINFVMAVIVGLILYVPISWAIGEALNLFQKPRWKRASIGKGALIAGVILACLGAIPTMNMATLSSSSTTYSYGAQKTTTTQTTRYTNYSDAANLNLSCLTTQTLRWSGSEWLCYAR